MTDDIVVQPKYTPLTELPESCPTAGIHKTNSFEDVNRFDITMMNYSLLRVADEWGRICGVDGVCKMALVTSKLLKDRRDLLMMPYGCKSSERQETIVLPID